MDEREVDWSNIPRELLPMIGKSLDARIDVLRFRSVCSFWRSSIPPTIAHSPRFPRKFPHPGTVFGSASALRGPNYYLCESTLYLLKQPDPFPASSSSRNKAWLIKVEESNPGKLQLFDPLSNHRFRFRFSPLPLTTLNLLNFSIVELGKAYTLRNQIIILPRSETERNPMLSDRSVTWLTKVVMSPSSAWSDADESAAVLILHEGKLAFSRYGDEKLTPVDQNSEYDDIIVYKGQFYAVDRLGTVSWIESSSLRLVPFSPPLCGLGNQKHLLESRGSLYVIDRYMENYNPRIRRYSRAVTIDFKVYKLDEEWGKWNLMKSLDDQAFVLGTDRSFSITAQGVVGCKENCIYFLDQQESRIFHLKDRWIDDLGSSMYHPPPFCGAPACLSSITH